LSFSIFINFWWGPGVARSWPQSLTCSEAKHRLALLVPGWVTTRVFSEESLPHMQWSSTNRNTPTKNASCLYLRSTNKNSYWCFYHVLVVKTERDRLAVKEQINFENKEHQLIQSIRDEEKETVLKELSTWKSKTEIIYDKSMKIMFMINNNNFMIFIL